MNFYEQTIIAKHDLTSAELEELIKKYSNIISAHLVSWLNLKNGV